MTRNKLESLPQGWHPQNHPNPLLNRSPPAASRRPLQPLCKTHELDLVLEARKRDRHLDDVEPLSDSSDPLVAADHCEPPGHGYILYYGILYIKKTERMAHTRKGKAKLLGRVRRIRRQVEAIEGARR
jgi:hypothetical protein